MNYPIVIGDISFESLQLFLAENFEGYQKIILCDENTEEASLMRIDFEGVPDLIGAETMTVPPGEESKSFAIVEQLVEAMLESGLTRKTLILNLGGGMVGDLGGFLASIYKRGIPFIQIPTSLLAMVDASVGSKTAINVGGIKNQAGVFSDPQGVFIYPGFLETLPERELKSGYAEMLKHALISDAEYWKTLTSRDWGQNEDWEALIRQSVDIKSAIVESDPLEKGPRKALNFGHTFGHALETLSHAAEKPLLHGEAIAFGIMLEAGLSQMHCGLSAQEYGEICEFISEHFGYLNPPKFAFESWVQIMRADKKNSSDKINFTLLTGIGAHEINREFEEAELQTVIDEFNAIDFSSEN
ncbi:3-dehydroquinate synthase [bacterium SCSIO 12741]|nr:3-dehydroquinate synthase [bacterium SCSIO 12741]